MTSSIDCRRVAAVSGPGLQFREANGVTWKLTRDPAAGWLVLNFEGDLTRQDCVRGTREALSCVEPGQPAAVLVDARAATCVLSVGDIYAVPAMWEHAMVHRGSALAMVVADAVSLQRDIEFFENTCRNRGWNVHVFDDIDAAQAWLGGQVRRGAVGHG